MKRYIIPLQMNDGNSFKIQVQSKDNSNNKRKVKTWSSEEDQRLINLHNQYPKKWNIIAQLMGNRNQNQCLHRFRRISRLGSFKKIWSPREDQIVIKMVLQVGNNWKLISNRLGTKSGKQIRQRFINKLDPNIKREEWSQEQDLKLIQLYSKFGSKWCQISKQLTGRPQNKIKNRFYSFIQKNYSFQVQGKQKQFDSLSQNKQNCNLTLPIKVILNKKKKKNFGQRHNQMNLFLSNSLKQQRIKNQNLLIFDQQQSQIQNKNQQSNQQQFEGQYEIKLQERKGKEQSMKQINDINDIMYSRRQQSDFLYFQDNEN